MRAPIAVLVAAALVSACSGRGGGGQQAAPTGAASDAGSPAVHAIPEALRGRWGINPQDCEPGRSDAKGLMTLGADSAAFYESRGQLGAIASVGPEHVRATFAFTGEGKRWSYEEVLELLPDNRTLVRREYGSFAIAGRITYARCS